MPIPNISQPKLLAITDTLRLRAFDGCYDFAFSWYQDPELVWLVDGVRQPYTWETLSNMYRYLDKHGELYFIEVLEGEEWKPIGDVCFSWEDLPIVIGDPAYRGKGIGKAVISALIRRGRELGCEMLRVREIYHWNTASRKCFESLGFRECGKTEKGASFELTIDS